MELKELIGNNLAWWIYKREYKTLEKFAYENDLNKTTVTQLVKGMHMPKADLIIKLVDLLEIEPNDLMQMPKPKPNKWGTKLYGRIESRMKK